MGGRHVMVILGAAGALMATAPATDAAASFKWTAASIGEAFGPGHTATEVRDGLLFAGGGDPYLSGGNILCCRPTRRSYDFAFPVRRTQRFAQMTTPRAGHHAVLLLDSRVLVVGGDASGTTSEVWESHLGADSWTRVGDLPAPVGLGAIAVALNNGKVLYAGGSDSPSTPEPTARAALFDQLSTFSWSSTGSLVTARRDAASEALPDGRALVSGGEGSGGAALASAETFDPATGTWSPVASMTTPRVGHALVRLDDGRVLAVGGTASASAEIYDPATDRWAATPPPGQVAGASFASVPVVHAVKLADGSVVAVDAVHTARFDPSRNTWRRLPDAPFGGHRYGSLVRTFDGRVLYAYGVLPGAGGVSASADVLGPPVVLRVLSATGERVRYRVGERGPTRFSLARARHGKFRRLRGRVVRDSFVGVNELSLRGRWRGHRLQAGLYRLKVVASSRTELVQSRPRFVRFRVR